MQSVGRKSYKLYTLVWVMYDGKYSRRVPGLIVKTCRGNGYLVRFIPMLEDKSIVMRFNSGRGRYKRTYGYYRDVDKSIARSMFGLPGDPYYICKIKNFKSGAAGAIAILILKEKALDKMVFDLTEEEFKEMCEYAMKNGK